MTKPSYSFFTIKVQILTLKFTCRWFWGIYVALAILKSWWRDQESNPGPSAPQKLSSLRTKYYKYWLVHKAESFTYSQSPWCYDNCLYPSRCCRDVSWGPGGAPRGHPQITKWRSPPVNPHNCQSCIAQVETKVWNNCSSLIPSSVLRFYCPLFDRIKYWARCTLLDSLRPFCFCLSSEQCGIEHITNVSKVPSFPLEFYTTTWNVKIEL